jgi:HD superfamily phosphohydrolase
MEAAIERYEERLLSGPLAPVLRHKMVERLRHVSFLGTMPLVYPGALDCSRYEHSLGVAAMGALVAESLGLSEYLRAIYELYGLVHDVGHAPLSHATEVFLARRSRLYHEGRTLSLLRRRDFTRLLAKVPVFKGREGEVVETLSSLLGDGKPKEALPLLGSAISTDSLDYVPRCRRYLGLASTDSVAFAQSLRMLDGRAKTGPEGLDFLTEFWRMETELYTDHIYTDKVLAAEAMVTRALEIALAGRSMLPDLHEMTDVQFRRLLERGGASALVDEIWRGAVYQPLSKLSPEHFESLSPRFEAAVRDAAEKAALEEGVAIARGIPAEQVIFHWSFVRRFFLRSPSAPRSQLWLFSEFDPWRNLRDEIDVTEALSLFGRSRATNVRHEVFVKVG